MHILEAIEVTIVSPNTPRSGTNTNQLVRRNQPQQNISTHTQEPQTTANQRIMSKHNISHQHDSKMLEKIRRNAKDSQNIKQKQCQKRKSAMSPENKIARHSPKHEYELRKRQKICYDENEDTDEMSLDTNDSTAKSTRSLNNLT